MGAHVNSNLSMCAQHVQTVTFIEATMFSGEGLPGHAKTVLEFQNVFEACMAWVDFKKRGIIVISTLFSVFFFFVFVFLFRFKCYIKIFLVGHVFAADSIQAAFFTPKLATAKTGVSHWVVIL